jgi:hypothetical protein
MSRANAWRVVLLCEDRRTERFFTKLLRRYGIEVLEVRVAPEGRGAADAWAKKQLRDEVRKLRSKNFQRSRGLWIVIDADEVGVTGRLREFHVPKAPWLRAAQRSADASRPLRARQGRVGTSESRELKDASVDLEPVKEHVAFLIPAQNIETWLAALNGLRPLSESVDYKHPSNEVHGEVLAASLRALWEPKQETRTLDQAVAAWKRDPPALPALERAYAETARFGA